VKNSTFGNNNTLIFGFEDPHKANHKTSFLTYSVKRAHQLLSEHRIHYVSPNTGSDHLQRFANFLTAQDVGIIFPASHIAPAGYQSASLDLKKKIINTPYLILYMLLATLTVNESLSGRGMVKFPVNANS